MGVADVLADLLDRGIGDAFFKQDLAGDAVFTGGEAEVVGRAGPGVGDEDAGGEAVAVKFGGGKGPGFQAAAEQDDRVSLLRRVVDDPEVGEAGQNGRTEKVEKRKETTEKEKAQGNAAEATGPAAGANIFLWPFSSNDN